MIRFAAAVLVLALTPAALFAAEGTFDRTLHVNGTATLKVSTGAGYIHITPGPDGSIHITGHIHASGGWFGPSAEKRAQQVAGDPPITQKGNSIEVGQHTRYDDVAIDYVITAPRGTSVNASSDAGNLNISNLDAPLTATASSGDIDASDLTGSVALNTGSGNITALMNHAQQVRVGAGSGNIHLQGVTGGLYAETGSGDIEVDGEPGANWKLALASGSVTLRTGGHARFTLDALTGHGIVRYVPPLVPRGRGDDPRHVIGDVNGGGPTVHIQTGSGNIQIY